MLTVEPRPPICLLVTAKLGAGKEIVCSDLVYRYGGQLWARAELMRQIAYGLIGRAGNLDDGLRRVFPDDDLRDEVRKELLHYVATYEPEPGKPFRLLQEVVELCQRHDPLCFDLELEQRMRAAGGSFAVVKGIRSRESFEHFRSEGAASVRVVASNQARRERLRRKHGELDFDELFEHESETILDDLPHDFIIHNESDDIELIRPAVDRLMHALHTGRYLPGAEKQL